MATNISELAALRAVTFRISSTPPAHLPPQIPAITSVLGNCKSILSSAPAPGGSKSASEASVAVHKFRTQLSTLLQDRTAQGRWAAVVLVKSTIEIGGWETLQKSLPWVRGLLGILTKPDPQSSKKLSIITLTRIFSLTRDFQTLVREITTPSLPAFIQSCLQLANSSGSGDLLYTILEAFNHLLPRHPTIFRTFIKQILQILTFTLAPTPSTLLSPEQSQGLQFTVSSETVHAARRLCVQLPTCAPKSGSSDEWRDGLEKCIDNAHAVADKVFRAVIEDWRSSSGAPNREILNGEPEGLQPDSLGLPNWKGIYAGGERLEGVLRLVKSYIIMPTPNPVNLRVNNVLDLLRRIFSITPPAPQGNPTFNNQVSKEERENLWAILPSIHVAAIEILLVLVNRYQDSFAPLVSLVLDQLIWVFNAERGNIRVRTAVYIAVRELLKLSGLALPKSSIDPLATIIRSCCNDLLPSDLIATKKVPAQAKTNGGGKQQSSTNADTFLNSASASTSTPTELTGLKESALLLLPFFLTYLPVQHLSDSIRTRIDRTAILIQDKDAMIASVLNPPPSKKFGKPAASLLPLLARSAPDSKEVEVLLRPRMPVIRIGAGGTEEEDDNDDEDEGPEDSSMDIDEEEVEQSEEPEQNEPAPETAEPTPSLYPILPQPQQTPRNEPTSESASKPKPLSVPAALPDEDSGLSQITEQSIQQELASSAKRARLDLPPSSPSSPSKRPRIEETVTRSDVLVEQTVASSSISVVTTTAPAVSSSLTATGTYRESNTPAADDSDGDEDDFGGLVMGQDTDDESDA